jgi:uncharacterized protein DUF1707
MTEDTFASDAEREQAVTRLREASAEGRLTLEELSVRTDAAYTARTHAELVLATAGLPTGAVARKGSRLVAGLFAPARLDLRRSRARSVTVLALFAPVQVVVPEGTDVEVDVVGVFAPVRDAASRSGSGASIRVRGLALFAPVVVRSEPS